MRRPDLREHVRRLPREVAADRRHEGKEDALHEQCPDQEPHDRSHLVAHDRADRESEAIRYYDAAYRLGVPAEDKRRFYVGFGSTLRNVGRADESVAVLAEAIAEDPGYAPFHAFLALALFSSGHPREALATMLGVALDVAKAGAFDRYERALGEYHRELLGDASEPLM